MLFAWFRPWSASGHPPGPAETKCEHCGKTKPSGEHLVDFASRCEVSTDWLLGCEVVEAELLEETKVSFRDAVAGLPREAIEEIRHFIAFVREQRRREG